MSLASLMGAIDNLDSDERVHLDETFALLLKAHCNDQTELCPALLTLCNKLAEYDENGQELERHPPLLDEEAAYVVWVERACKLFKRAFPTWERDDEEIGCGNAPFTTLGCIHFDWVGRDTVWAKPVLLRMCNALVSADIGTRRYMQELVTQEQKRKESA